MRARHWITASLLTGALMITAASPGAARPFNFAQFGFGFGIGPQMYFGDENMGSKQGTCVNDQSLRSRLQGQGYGDIQIGAGNGDVTVDAMRNGIRYKLGVNSCSGRILSRQRAR